VSPTYAVDAVNKLDISLTVAFARLFNIRLVVKNTGHDLLGRSEGSYGLEVWLRHYRNGITYQKNFKSVTGCTASGWTGAAFKADGSYVWGDIYAQAKANNLIVVGGGTPSVGATGGWMQGGGHGPPSHQYGLGAQQVVEIEAILANGLPVTANACQHSDLFFALRGGGGGTYAVVLSTVVKAYPNTNIDVQHLAIGALQQTNTSGLLDVIATLYTFVPDMMDAGYAGYASWSVNSPSPLFANFFAGYVHGIYMFGKSQAQAQKAFDAARTALIPYNLTSVFISETYVSYPDYWSFYAAESGVEPPVGSEASLASRLLDRNALTSNYAALRNTIGVIAGQQGEYTSNAVEYVAPRQDLGSADGAGILPAWRTSYLSNIVARGWAPGTPESYKGVVRQDIENKANALKQLAPNTGAYMNEGDRLDPDFKTTFYGSNYNKLLSIKDTYDRGQTFYCPTCVGSDRWSLDGSGRLCQV
jgi:FAD binding domain/Berberine and berberine like